MLLETEPDFHSSHLERGFLSHPKQNLALILPATPSASRTNGICVELVCLTLLGDVANTVAFVRLGAGEVSTLYLLMVFPVDWLTYPHHHYNETVSLKASC